MVPASLDRGEDVSLQRPTHSIHWHQHCVVQHAMQSHGRTCRHIVVCSAHELLKCIAQMGILGWCRGDVCVFNAVLCIISDMHDNLQRVGGRGSVIPTHGGDQGVATGVISYPMKRVHLTINACVHGEST